MEKSFDYKKWEEKLKETWNKPDKKDSQGEPYTVLMPPPNANASLHAGHAMYTVDDIMIRFKRMQGFNTSWIPGLDHAGFETQYVYEKHLAKEGKSRFDFDRQALYDNVFEFVKTNSGLIYEQMKRLGFMADWDKSVFTLDQNVIDTVYSTFEKMHSENLIYRDDYIVNYCTKDGTSLAELEVKYVERKDPLYYIKYKLVDSDEYISVATVRPEPIFIDTHLAVNPTDKKHAYLVGKEVENPLTGAHMPIIADEYVDPKFGTGIVKLTPAHDPNDFNLAKKHNLPIKSALNQRGKIINSGDLGLDGLNVKDARAKVIEILKERGAIDKIDENYEHSVSTCYKCGRDIEPLIIPNWFIKVAEIKKPVIATINENKVKFTPKRFKKQILQWMEIMHDWPISRQIVWGIRIPVWYPTSPRLRGAGEISVSFVDKSGEQHFGDLDKFLEKFELSEIKKGLQSLIADPSIKYVISDKSPGEDYLPETDTFDTWFSSGQWPIVTSPPNYPTDFMGTLSDILKFWISRMIMFGLYLKNDVPFRDVYLWPMVADQHGLKMSKSKGNVINPIELIDKYGADALRMSLMFGTASGHKTILAEDKVKSMRNFANKVWNVARYVQMDQDKAAESEINDDDKWILEELEKTIEAVTKALEEFKFNIATESIYEFVWHKFADIYIEKVKDRKPQAQNTLDKVLDSSLKMLHPFMPFVTQAIWESTNSDGLITDSSWPKVKSS